MDSSDPEATGTPSNSCETFLVLAARVEKDRLPGSYCLVVTVVVVPLLVQQLPYFSVQCSGHTHA